MNETEDIAPILKALWPTGETGKAEVYAVLDGARDRRIEHLLLLWGLEHECLYRAVGPELRNAAPFLVRLEREAAGTLELLREGAGQDWGIFAVAPENTGFRGVLRHCRRLMRVLDEAGQIMLFRYYDPNVMAAFSIAKQADQNKDFFGPISAFIFEKNDLYLTELITAAR
jgi:hypothetical protein